MRLNEPPKEKGGRTAMAKSSTENSEKQEKSGGKPSSASRSRKNSGEEGLQGMKKRLARTGKSFFSAGRGEAARGKKKRSAREERERKAAAREKTDKNILKITYAFAALFIGMCVYFGWFLQFDSENVINSSYNARLDRFSDRIVRGKILNNDGRVLAETQVAGDGSEKRYYPYNYLFVHSVGYSGKNGKTGIESLANFYLLSSHVNLLERTVNELQGRKNIGDNVVTTLDVDLQQTASDAMGNRRGAVIAMEPDTGKILAMVSQPNFNANTVDEQWAELTSPENTKAQLVNRATQGLYPPGSTFKILTALEYIHENPNGRNDFHFDCDGTFEDGEYQIRCYHGESHGSQDFRGVFANSCNGAFSSIGLGLNLTQFRSLAEQFLFNRELPLSIPYNKSSFVMAEGADEWERLQTSIGQGKTQMTPMHNLMITAAIANGGTLMKPYLIDHVENAGGQTVKKFMPSAYGGLMSGEDAAVLTELMTAVVTEGTGSALRGAPYTAAGKTGSAEFKTGKETHAWFVGFAPVEDPKIAVCVILEESGSGGSKAGPVARAVMDKYFEKNPQ